MSTKSNNGGFTAVEVLVVVAVSSLVLALSFGAASDFLDRWRIDAASRDIVSALRAARAQAILGQTEVSMPFDETRRVYVLTTDRGASGVFNKGGIYYAELPGNVQFCSPDAAKPIGFSPPAAPKETVAVFDPAGLLRSNNIPSNVFVCDSNRDAYRRISVSPVGTITISRWTGKSWE